MNALLQLRGITKEFPGVRALDAVDFDLQPGEVHALLGENGAGKSTLVKIMTGAYTCEGGSITLAGETIRPESPGHAQQLGISPVYQEVNLLPNLTVAQNIFLGREPRKLGFIQWRAINNASRELLKSFHLDIDVTQPLARFSVAVQQLIAIARGVNMSARVLILDEPTASLDQEEVQNLFNILRRLKSEGMGIVFITHFLDQVYAVTDRITVLRNGCKIGTFKTEELPRPKLVEHMLGKELQQVERAGDSEEKQSSATPLIQLENAGSTGSVHGISFQVARGEAAGIAGLLGSGRTEVCNLVFGIDAATTGNITFDGEPLRGKKPADAISKGIAFCPEDRKVQGIIGPLSIRENIILALQAQTGWWRPLSRRRQQALCEEAIARLKIATPNGEKPVEELSGGNQQKVILARWLATQPRLLIMDEPTRGIDIGAHAEIIRLIQTLRQEGMALLVTSSETEELVAFSTKILVMRERKLVAELTGTDITEDKVLHAIATA